MPLRFAGSFFVAASVLYGVHSSPSGPSLDQHAGFHNMTVEDMFGQIWEKFSEHGLMNLQQLNALLHDTDQEHGEQVVHEDWWLSLCMNRGADPSKGLSKFDLLNLYFESPGSSIKKDFIRIFFEGAPPAETQGKDLLKKPASQMEEKEMFDEIWVKYSEYGLINLHQLNALLHDTDQERGEQIVDEAWWQKLCMDKGVDPSKGLSKFDLLSFYFDNPGSSIKQDFMRIFLEADPPAQTQGKNMFQKPMSEMEETQMFDEIWAKFSEHELMNLQQLNALLHDTDQESGEQVVDEDFWQTLVTHRGGDPSKGLSKSDLLNLYFENPGSSIKKDFMRMFFEGAPPAKSQRKILSQQLEPQTEEKEMFDEIWTKYSANEFINLPQLNALLHDADQERGDQVVDEAWWQKLCTSKKADPSKGLSKFDLLSFYFEDPGSSIKRDFMQIFIKGAPPAETQSKNSIQKPQLDTEEKLMFDEIWAKYSTNEFINLHQLNALLHDTDQEHGEQAVGEAWWQKLCTDKGADPINGLSKIDLLSFYFEDPGSSIKKDFMRIFFEGAPPADKKSQMETKEMFDEIWAKYSEHDLMNMQQLNALLHDTDQERGEQIVDEAWWQKLCMDKGANPSKGLSKINFLSFYFEHEGSIRKDYFRIFFERVPPPPEMEEKKMFDEIWAKYSEHQLMNLQQINELLHDTNQEGLDDVEWQMICMDLQVDYQEYSKGITKNTLRMLYFRGWQGSSIKTDYQRIFVEGQDGTACTDMPVEADIQLTSVGAPAPPLDDDDSIQGLPLSSEEGEDTPVEQPAPAQTNHGKDTARDTFGFFAQIPVGAVVLAGFVVVIVETIRRASQRKK